MDFFEIRMDVEWYRYLAAFVKKHEIPKEAKKQADQNAKHKHEEEHQDHRHNAA
jgi:hypothetical protein